jgi:23S rRNA (uracil1939-C5)-methyltransferase
MSNITAEIESIALGGMGVLRHQGRVIFVPEVIPGEQIEAQIVKEKKNFAVAKLLKINLKSSRRIEPRCKLFNTCGGCNFQHMDYELQLEAKQQLVTDALSRIGKINIPVSIEPAQKTWEYRRHIRLKLWSLNSGFAIGFMSKEKTFVPIKLCHIFSEDKNIFIYLEKLVAQFDKNLIKDARVTILKDNQKAVLFFEFEPLMPKNWAQVLHNLEPVFKGVILADKKSYKYLGDTEVEINTAGLKFFCRPDAFVQNNPE